MGTLSINSHKNLRFNTSHLSFFRGRWRKLQWFIVMRLYQCLRATKLPQTLWLLTEIYSFRGMKARITKSIGVNRTILPLTAMGKIFPCHFRFLVSFGLGQHNSNHCLDFIWLSSLCASVSSHIFLSVSLYPLL